MYYYSLYCYKVCSDIFFPQLVSIEEPDHNEVDVLIEAGDIFSELLEESKNKYFEFGNDRSWLSNSTCWLVVEKGKNITYSLKEGGSSNYLKTYILGWGFAMLALQRGEMAMHCSSVSNDDNAILICGESGSGKSTLTSLLLNNGWKLMADDMAIVELTKTKEIIAKPGFPYQKMCRDAINYQDNKNREMIYVDDRKDKYLVSYKDKFNETKKIVKAIFILNVVQTNGTAIFKLQGLQKFYGIVNNLYLRNLLGEKKFCPEIGQHCLHIASSVDMYILERPQGKDTKNKMLESIQVVLHDISSYYDNQIDPSI